MSYLEKYLEINRCPHCGTAKPSIIQTHLTGTRAHDGYNHRYWGLYYCSRCGGSIIASSYEEKGVVEEMYPSDVTIDDSLPNKARSYLTQALDSIHAPSGAIMLAASAVDAMLKEKGLIEGSLYSRINKAVDENLMTSEMATWAHEIRLDANDERHADFNAKLPDSEDAKRTVDFALAMAEFLFVLPSKVRRGIKDASDSKDKPNEEN